MGKKTNANPGTRLTKTEGIPVKRFCTAEQSPLLHQRLFLGKKPEFPQNHPDFCFCGQRQRKDKNRSIVPHFKILFWLFNPYLCLFLLKSTMFFCANKDEQTFKKSVFYYMVLRIFYYNPGDKSLYLKTERQNSVPKFIHKI